MLSSTGPSSLLTKRRASDSPDSLLKPRLRHRQFKWRYSHLAFMLLSMILVASVIFNFMGQSSPPVPAAPLIWRVNDICGYKSSLYDTNTTRQIPPGNFFLAANFHQNENVLPHILHEIVRFLDLLGDDNRVFVSVFESGSVDLSKEWLLYFEDILKSRHIPNNIVISDSVRLPDEPRIDFLARVRNKALEPLFQKDSLDFVPDYVLFVNDVFLCLDDLIRLTQRISVPGTDMVCGLDFQFHNAVEGSTELTFYDTWVARDIEGNPLSYIYPFFMREEDQQRLAKSEPIPVFCCWNGLVATKAKVFLDGVRFRSEHESDCAASECTHFCRDIWNNGYQHIIIDPAIAVGYDHQVASHLAVRPPAGVGSFKNNPFAIVEYPETLPTEFMCHGVVGKDNSPSVRKRIPISNQ